MKKFLVNVDKCTGCNLCVIACKDEHVGNDWSPWSVAQPDTGHFWMNLLTTERGHLPRVRVSHMPMMCQHCENAPCMKVCPVNAIRRRPDGLVWIDPELCTGCGLCVSACPFDVVYMNADQKIAQKCTGCAHRVDVGELPRCVEICPHEAIMFGEETDVDTVAADAGEAYHPEFGLRPRVLWSGLPGRHIAGCVVDAASDDVLSSAEVVVTDLYSDDVVSAASNTFGEFMVRNLVEGRKYRVCVTKDDYQSRDFIVTMDVDHDLGDIELST